MDCELEKQKVIQCVYFTKERSPHEDFNALGDHLFQIPLIAQSSGDKETLSSSKLRDLELKFSSL